MTMAQLPPTEAFDTGHIIITAEYHLQHPELLDEQTIDDLLNIIEECIQRCKCYRVYADADRRAIVDLRVEQLRTLQSRLSAKTPTCPDTTSSQDGAASS